MSPEQTRGRPTKEGTDVWSFGVCLFEALSGTHPFARDTIPDILSAILTEEPPWDALPPGLPRSWRTLLERTLRKEARRRLHDIADVRIELEDAPTELEAPTKPGPTGTDGLTVPRWAAAGTLAGFAGLAVSLGWLVFGPGAGTGAPGAVVRRFTIELPATAPVSLDGASALALSRDGGRLVYTARRGDRTQLYLRALDGLDAVPIPGTEGAESPFFSPAGNDLGFFLDGALARAPVTGGGSIPLAPAETGRGASWWTDDIVFSPLSRGGLSLVSADGGGAREITTPPEEPSDPAHRWPQHLPGGRYAITTLWTRTSNDVAVVELASGATEVLIDDAAYGRYLPSGHLVFVRDGDLHAVAFDTGSRRPRGEPVVVLPSVAVDELTGAAFYDVSEDGALFYVAAESELSRPATLLGVDRNGVATPIGAPSPSLQVPRWSPDGRFILTTVQSNDATDVWSLQIGRGNLTRLTFDGRSAAAVWSPDGRRVVYHSSREGREAIYSKAADGSGEADVLTDGAGPLFPTSFSPDGETLAFTELNADTGFDIWLLRLEGRESTSFLATPVLGGRRAVLPRRPAHRLHLGRVGPGRGLRPGVRRLHEAVADLDRVRERADVVEGRKRALLPGRDEAHGRPRHALADVHPPAPPRSSSTCPSTRRARSTPTTTFVPTAGSSL